MLYALFTIYGANQAALLLEGQEILVFRPLDGDNFLCCNRFEEGSIHELDGHAHP